MAKINGVIIPRASGSIGNITFRTSGRQTVASEKIVTNKSRTAAQIEQRELFSEVMLNIRPVSPAAKYLYKKKGFRSPYAELSSRAMEGMYANADLVDDGVNFHNLAAFLNKPIVEGDIQATSVVYDPTAHTITIQVLKSDIDARHAPNSEDYSVTNAVTIYSGNGNGRDPENLLRVYPSDSDAINISSDDTYITVVITPSYWLFVASQDTPIDYTPMRRGILASISINGKRVGYRQLKVAETE